MKDRDEETEALLDRAGRGDHQALESLFSRYRERLLRMIRLRLDPRMRYRIDASDIIQEAQLEAWQRLEEYLGKRPMEFFLWLRFLTGQKLAALHRHHLGAKRRDQRQEVRLHSTPMPEATTAALANQLVGKHTSPDEAAMRAERKIIIQEAFNAIDPLDRQVLALRHFEQLTNLETAQELGLTEAGASKRYARALKKLQKRLPNLAKGTGGLRE
jgi:RNA polymerase sigma-70 factor (ECF subfamily)